MVYADTYINLVNNMETKKDERQTLSGVKIRIDSIELYKSQVIAFCTVCKMDQIAFVSEELMHIPENTQAPSQ